MIRRGVYLLIPALIGVLGLTGPPVIAASGEQDPGAAAVASLRHDADGKVRVSQDAAGRVTAVATESGARVDNPEVVRSQTVGSAAEAHLARYGAALGIGRQSSLEESASNAGPAGVDVVRFHQQVAGVAVLGGEVVLGLGGDRELRSLTASVSTATKVRDAVLPPAELASTALTAVRKRHPGADLTVADQGRRVLDPALVDLVLPGGVRTVRQFEVGDSVGIRELVLVDDRAGSVVLRSDLIAHLDRVVCDQNNVRSVEQACTTGFARTEAGPPSEVPDVEYAFGHAGETAGLYAEVGGVDLTDLLGVDTATGRHLAATVRYCTNVGADPCPFPNAFWNGTQMFYGDGYAAADDVVGHEITHGFIDHRSKLFYWGQSGAINESMADVIGEIVDQRSGADDDTAWGLGEDLPGGALRSMQDPTATGQPDRMTSALWTADTNYQDNGGVHHNSGVGNKTAYLISRGGDFNGQSITGIDGADPAVTKTARLYLDVIGRLPSGATYAHLATALEQSCADLRVLPGSGFTAADCVAVHAVTVATELRSPPVVGATPVGADTSCPAGATKVVLLDAEAGDPYAKMTVNQWSRPENPGDANAFSGSSSWFAVNRSVAGSRAIQTVSVDLPSGQSAYLSFQHWWLLDYEPGYAYDGGIVQVSSYDPAQNLITTYLPASGDWVNGPASTIASGYENPRAGTKAFGGDSRGWRGSRVDLSARAGTQTSVAFALATDSSVGFIGWYVDDIQIYTCRPDPGPVAGVSTTGTPRTSANGPVRQRISWKAPLVNPSAVTGYRVLVDGVLRVTTAPSARSVDLALTTTARHTVSVRAYGAGGYQAAAVSARTVPSALSLTLARSGTTVKLSGALKRAGSGFGGQKVWIERKSGTSWTAVGSTTTTSTGAYVLKTTRSTQGTYRVRYAGGPATTGTFSPNRTG